MNRRNFITTMAAAGAAGFLSPKLFSKSQPFQFNCFTKHLQWLDYKETAQVLKEAGYTGDYHFSTAESLNLIEKTDER